MHDREDAGAAEILAFDPLEVFEQALHRPLPLRKVDGMRAVCRASISPVASIDASVWSGSDRLDADVGGEIELQLLACGQASPAHRCSR